MSKDKQGREPRKPKKSAKTGAATKTLQRTAPMPAPAQEPGSK